MASETSIMTEIGNAIMASATIAAAAWGAAGGITSAIAVKVDRRAVLRQVFLGALVAGGMGTGGMAMVAHWLGMPASAIVLGGAGGAGSYVVGLFGPAIIEVILGRIYAGRLPTEGDGK